MTVFTIVVTGQTTDGIGATVIVITIGIATTAGPIDPTGLIDPTDPIGRIGPIGRTEIVIGQIAAIAERRPIEPVGVEIAMTAAATS
jgi:hypothetical protein